MLQIVLLVVWLLMRFVLHIGERLRNTRVPGNGCPKATMRMLLCWEEVI